MTTSSLFPILISVVAIYAAVADGFSSIRFATTRKNSCIHKGRQLSNPDVRFHLFSSNHNDDSQVDKKLSKKEQEDLWLSNALYFDQKKKSKGSSSVNPSDELELSLPKHITSNTWPRSSFGRKLKKRAARPWIRNVEIRELQSPHPLAGQLGLFAAATFRQFDVLGEYCGEVFDADDGGEYATYLENRDEKYALGVDAQHEGTEARFINHYAGITEENKPNVVMKVTYVEELPRVMIVCMRDIQVGEEFLLQYSDEYVQEYIG